MSFQRISVLLLVFSIAALNFCRAESEFSSDIESIGLMIGISQFGEGCAEIGRISGSPDTYRTDIRSVPNRICDMYQQPTYAEYVEVMRSQLKLMSRLIQRYSTANCTMETNDVLASINDSTLSPVIHNTSAIIQPLVTPQYTDYRWIQVHNPVFELKNRFTDLSGWNDSIDQAKVARMARFNEYIDFMAGELIKERAGYNGNADCAYDIESIRGWAHPGWRYLMIDKDTINLNAQPVVMVGRCSYNDGSPACATNIGPLF